MNYPDTVRYLYSLGNEVKTVKLGLDRIQRLMAGLDHPERRCGRVIHVAGTNGKGSTCAMIEAALRASGRRTGLYTSPHLVDPTERVRISGVPVTAEEFSAAFDHVHAVAERLVAAGELDMHPTYFETMTAMAFVIFAQRGVDDLVLEVGLGGRLDATNVVTPALCVITPVDMDHMQWLGDTIEKIAFEKAGIIKPGVPVMMARQHALARDVIRTVAAGHGAELIETKKLAIEDLSLGPYSSRYRLAGELSVECPLAGEHQVENSRTAAIALRTLGLTPDQIRSGIAQAKWPGRLERVATKPDIILDGAHNVAGVAALVNYIGRFHANRRVWIVFGVMQDKEVETITRLLFPLAQSLILTTPAQTRAMLATGIAKLPAARDARVTSSTPEALALIREAKPADVVFITGSLFLVGEARQLLLG